MDEHEKRCLHGELGVRSPGQIDRALLQHELVSLERDHASPSQKHESDNVLTSEARMTGGRQITDTMNGQLSSSHKN
jgi:hypothetical protein